MSEAAYTFALLSQSIPKVIYTYRFEIPMNNTAPTDWANAAVPTVRAVLAEAFTAELAAAQSVADSVTWYGGQNAAFDVEGVEEHPNPNWSPGADLHVKTKVRRDAKSVRLLTNTEGDHVVLARTNAQPYSPTKVDVITLVHLEVTTGFAVNLDAGTAVGQASGQVLDAWDVPVGRMNELLAQIDEARGETTIRNSNIHLDDIEEFRVTGRIRDFYPAWLEDAKQRLEDAEAAYVADWKHGGNYDGREDAAVQLITALLQVHVGRRIEGYNLHIDSNRGASIGIYYESMVTGELYPLDELVEMGVLPAEVSARIQDILPKFGQDPDTPGQDYVRYEHTLF